MTTTTRKPQTALGWFPLTPVTESAVIDMANARQIALRTRLRHHYWITEGKPIDPITVGLQRRKMAMIDTHDTLTEEQVSELMSSHYGFVSTGAGWIIPDLDDARGNAIQSVEAIRARASAGGRARAAKAGAVFRETVDAETGEITAGNPDDF